MDDRSASELVGPRKATSRGQDPPTRWRRVGELGEPTCVVYWSRAGELQPSEGNVTRYSASLEGVSKEGERRHGGRRIVDACTST